ncbi:hypothetical protein NX059_002523 [Plenodomus lindquistii]|nr:hypothetical protein NX059_002523 [Plenodomus lindquistii]
MRMPPLFFPMGPHHMPYPSSEFTPSPTASASDSEYWNAMSQINIPQRNSKSDSPTEKKAAATPPDNGGFTFITAGKPADFKSKRTMTQVRKKAMGSFLEKGKSKDGVSRDSAEGSNSVTSGASQHSPIVEYHLVDLSRTPNVVSSESTTVRKKKSMPPRRVARDGLGSSVSRSSSPNQVAIVSTRTDATVPPAVLIVPPRDRKDLPFDHHEVLSPSLGLTLDPFGTMFQSSNARVCVENLKWNCSRYYGTRGLGQYWIPHCLDHPHTFLSTLCLAAAHKDVLEERQTDSLETTALRQDTIKMVGENLLNSTKSVADHNIMAVSQLIICEVILRKGADLAFHESGMEAMIKQRGGLSQLGVHGYLASTSSWIHLISAILRGAEPRPMYFEFCVQNPATDYPPSATIPDSPIFCPRERLYTLEKSKKCSSKALDLLNDVRKLVDLFLHDTREGQPNSPATTTLCMKITNDYAPTWNHAESRVVREDEWKYEAIRLTAVVLATAITQRLPLPSALACATTARHMSITDTTSVASRSNDSLFSTLENQQITPVTDYSISPSFSMAAPTPGIDSSYFIFDAHSLATSPSQASSSAKRPSIASTTYSSEMSNYRLAPPKKPATSGPLTILKDTKDALEKSNLSDCWKDMAGVLLWVGLVMGAASRDSESKVLSRYFSATTMRAAIMLCFDHPSAMHSTMLKMTEIVKALSTSQGTTDVATTHKKRKA